MEKQVYWCGEVKDECNVCKGSFNGTMYDANLRMGWANCCHRCFMDYGMGLGMGRGQKYEQQETNRWLKVAG